MTIRNTIPHVHNVPYYIWFNCVPIIYRGSCCAAGMRQGHTTVHLNLLRGQWGRGNEVQGTTRPSPHHPSQSLQAGRPSDQYNQNQMRHISTGEDQGAPIQQSICPAARWPDQRGAVACMYGPVWCLRGGITGSEPVPAPGGPARGVPVTNH